MEVIAETKGPEITVLARSAHLARIISHGIILVLSVSQITGGKITVNGSTDAATGTTGRTILHLYGERRG